MINEVIELSADNNLVLVATVMEVDETTLEETPVTSGVITAYISNASDGAVLHADLEVVLTHVVDGQWLIKFTGDKLTKALLDQFFLNTKPFLLIKRGASIKQHAEMVYRPKKVSVIQ